MAIIPIDMARVPIDMAIITIFIAMNYSLVEFASPRF
jgi:hypothetical protein